MKKILALLLVAALALTVCACGGGSDPNEGVYEATKAEYKGLSVKVEDAFEGGFKLELKSGGRAVLTTGGEDYNIKWSLDGEAFHLTAADSEYDGTLADGTLVLHNILDSGIDLTLEKTE